MSMIRITAGGYTFLARLEEQTAPESCAAFRSLLPLQRQVLQARWSGQAAFVPLGDVPVDAGLEDATSYPLPGQIVLYPGGASGAEILIPYGPTCFASKAGQLAGSHFLTLTRGAEQLTALGEAVWWRGALDIEFAPA